MRILAVDTTGLSMSVAVSEGEMLLGEMYADNGRKHSITLMTAIDSVLKLLELNINDIDAFAVTIGPGSFTGIRIGTAAVSAMAYATQKPVFAVNTLDALMQNAEVGATVCAIMDARRGEVYTAARRGSECIVAERAQPLVELLDELTEYENVLFVGDAAARYADEILDKKPDSRFMRSQFILQRAASVCMCVAAGMAKQTDYRGVKPHYLRESQAERMKRMREIEQ